MIDLQIQHHFTAGVYAKQMHLPAGHFAQTHQHQFAHLSILAVGSVIVEVAGETSTYHAPACIEIKAGVTHKITALCNVDWFCIHATDETDVNAVDEVLIMRGI